MAASEDVEDELALAGGLVEAARDSAQGGLSVADRIAAAQVHALMALARAVDNLAKNQR